MKPSAFGQYRITLTRKGPRASRGISLIEVLVVTSVLGIMFSVTVPVVTSMRSRGKNAQCMNNLRNIIVGYHLFMVANEGHVPMAALSSRSKAAKGISSSKKNWTHNLVGYYFTRTGFRPQGLGELVAGRFLDQSEVFYCPSDDILLPDSEITGLKNPTEGWWLKSPLESSYIVRPFGNPVWREKKSALSEIFDTNKPSQAFITESSNNHTDGVFVGRIDGAVEFVRGVPIPVQASKAFGVKVIIKQKKKGRKKKSYKKFRQSAYRFVFRKAPWIWFALDDPDNAEQIVARYSRDR